LELQDFLDLTVEELTHYRIIAKLRR